MKFLFTLVTFIAFTSAEASYMATHCSNSQATIKWETGHNSNTLTLKNYPNFEDEMSIPYYHLKVEFITNVKIDEERVSRCGYASRTDVFAGKVVIMAAEDHPTALDFLGENKKISTEVICTTHVNSRAPCP